MEELKNKDLINNQNNETFFDIDELSSLMDDFDSFSTHTELESEDTDGFSITSINQENQNVELVDQNLTDTYDIDFEHDSDNFFSKPKSSHTNNSIKKEKPIDESHDANQDSYVSMIVIDGVEDPSFSERILYGALFLAIYGVAGIVIDITAYIIGSIFADNFSVIWLFTPILSFIGLIVGFISSQDGASDISKGVIFAVGISSIIWFLFIIFML